MIRYLYAIAAAACRLLPDLRIAPLTPRRRRLLVSGAMLAAATVLAEQPAAAPGWELERWTATWGAAPEAGASNAAVSLAAHGGRNPTANQTANQTIRLVATASLGGNRVRVRLSNETGSAPLRIGAARIGLRASGSSVAPGTDRPLRFGGATAPVLAPGAPALSDPVELNVPPLAQLVVSLYLPDAVALPPGAAAPPPQAGHAAYLSPPGDHTAAATLPVQRALAGAPFLTAVEVDTAGAALVLLGDARAGWSALLARRLHGERRARIGVVDRGADGDRLLGSAPGHAQQRFDRDVLATGGVRYLVLQLGGVDVADGAALRPPTADEMVAGYRQLLVRARAARLRVIGTTLAPFEGAAAWSAEKEALRQAVNAWIRTGGEFDAVLDADRALRDPLRPARLLPAYDSGDHLRPSEAGLQALADAAPLALLAE